MNNREQELETLAAEISAGLWNGLALSRYDVIGRLNSPSGDPVILMREKTGGAMPYCAEYRGSGQYFRDFNSLASYTIARFGSRRLSAKDETRLCACCREHRKSGVLLRNLI